MTQLAHLSDLHLLEDNHRDRRGPSRRRLSYLTLGQTPDAPDRRRRAARALEAARRSGADHVLITGDLTEDGLPSQFEVLAEVLAESRIPASQVTLLAGNHDGYDHGEAFADALAGPLRPYAATSAPGVPIVLRDATILPMSTSRKQPYTRSAGELGHAAVEGAAGLALRCQEDGRALVLAMHHSPRALLPIQNWIDGLLDHTRVGDLLARHDHVHVVHGHTHRVHDDPVRAGARPRIFGTEAVMLGKSPVRLYHARHGQVWPAAQSSWVGAALAVA